MIQNLTKFATIVFDGAMNVITRLFVGLLITFGAVVLLVFGFTAGIVQLVN